MENNVSIRIDYIRGKPQQNNADTARLDAADTSTGAAALQP
jgi:hypothetical protein